MKITDAVVYCPECGWIGIVLETNIDNDGSLICPKCGTEVRTGDRSN